MNILPPHERHVGGWPIILCAWCGYDLNANATLGVGYDAREHFSECQLFLTSQEGYIWSTTTEGKMFLGRAERPDREVK